MAAIGTGLKHAASALLARDSILLSLLPQLGCQHASAVARNDGKLRKFLLWQGRTSERRDARGLEQGARG